MDRNEMLPKAPIPQVAVRLHYENELIKDIMVPANKCVELIRYKGILFEFHESSREPSPAPDRRIQHYREIPGLRAAEEVP